jgi:hypothetical protein
MKKNLILGVAMILWSNLPLLAQKSPLVGTWEMVSAKGIDPKGQKVSFDAKTYRETKIITPTHYMLMTHQVKGDSLVFDHCVGGTIRISGNKFMETPTMASRPEDLQYKTDFTWKVAGDKMIQKGQITLPDGKTWILEELIFKRSATPGKEMIKTQ